MLPVPNVASLAVFTGRAANTFSVFADQALAQATLLFCVITRLEALPDDPDLTALATNGILQMADRLYLEQPYAAAKATPYQSETLMSYSYAKLAASVTAKVGNSEPTGLFWWDRAVEELSQVQRSLVTTSAIEVFTEELYRTATGVRVLPGPASIQFSELLPPPDRSGQLSLENMPEAPGSAFVLDVPDLPTDPEVW